LRAIDLSLPAARRILDFGCGSGWVLAEAAKTGSPLCVGVDYSLKSLQGIGVPVQNDEAVTSDVHLVAGSGLSLPFANEVFDVVVGHVSMPYLNTRAGLQEIYRVLAPGGSILLTFHSVRYLTETLGKSLAAGHWKNVIFMGYLAVNGLLNHFSLPQTQLWWNRSVFETINTAAGISATARRAGFVMISIELVADRMFFAMTARKPGPNGVLPAPAYAIYSKLLSTGL